MSQTILLVDDLQMFLEIQRDFFKWSSVNIVTAKNGQEALSVMSGTRTDLVFLDLEMPVMDGASCCKAIKAHPKFRKTPVVIVTSSVNQKDKCIEAGCDRFLTKPVGRERFLEISREFIPGIDRRTQRVPCRAEGTITLNGKTVKVLLHDLSMEGAFIATDYDGCVNEVISLLFTLPTGRLDCVAKIVWKNRDTTPKYPKGIGVKFALVSQITRTALTAFLDPC